MIAVVGTQAIATVIAVYGLFMTPLGWGWAAAVWVYALAWFLVSDRIKLLAYRILEPEKKSRIAAPALDPDDLGSMGFPAASIGPNSARYSRTRLGID